MKLKFKYLLLILLGFLMFNTNVNATTTTCNYININKEGVFKVSFTFDSNNKQENVKATVEGYLPSTDETHVKKCERDIENWNKKDFLPDWEWFSYWISSKTEGYGYNGEGCPDYTIFIDKPGNWDLYVSDEEELHLYEEFAKEKQGYVVCKYDSLIGTSINATFHPIEEDFDSNKLKEDVTGQMDSTTFNYAEDKISKNKYSLYGYYFKGWHVKFNGNWLCKTEKENEFEFKSTCEQENRKLYLDQEIAAFPFEDNKDKSIDLYAVWQPKSDIDSQSINYYKLGKGACLSAGFVWNSFTKDEEDTQNGYCNVDRLKYAVCGDAHDIPESAPRIISFLVNLLKIATPIILIFVSIIALVKAITSQKEDEIKKAQTSLVKKVIAAAMVFFIVSIVQFVIMKLADSDEKGHLSSCLSCFLNNDCDKNLYYKTNIGGDYYCTTIEEAKDGTFVVADDKKLCKCLYDENADGCK